MVETKHEHPGTEQVASIERAKCSECGHVALGSDIIIDMTWSSLYGWECAVLAACHRRLYAWRKLLRERGVRGGPHGIPEHRAATPERGR